MNEDFLDFVAALLASGAEFMIVGAHAMAVQGVPRATGDLDVWVRAAPANATKVWNALLAFGAPVKALGILPGDFQQPGAVVQVGLPPRRIDILTSISGVEFDEASQRTTIHRVGTHDVPFLGLEDLIRNKQASARPKDLLDVALLEAKKAHP